ncbi:uncharacterized protein LOC133780547 [Humulus lupulus]|uniref:uncharacterized protein LOC133780547 n=1 Tax=Humulus lupulus TaxID=3486 RepID=UPI002B40398D|nr:uncharacterized protein LOC133780547 [Humulus lupulus]
MVARIRVWSSRHISYAGKCTLINSVLLTIHTYWAQILILPKFIVDRINSICRAFLWKSNSNSCGSGLVAWKNVCLPKDEGGLGFRDIDHWNIGALSRYVWDIVKKKDNLWVRWVHSVYIKGDCWWSYEAPQNASWYWKKIVMVKNIIKNKMEESIFTQMNFSITKVCSLLWLKSNVRKVWFSSIWNRLSTPKHKFITWLACLNRLQTRERLLKIGQIVDANCLFCGAHLESHLHLFFRCHFSSTVAQIIFTWADFKVHKLELEACIKKIKRSKHSKFRREVYLAIVNSLVYNLWEARNNTLWNDNVYTVHTLVQKIKRGICIRFSLFKNEKTSHSDCNWFEQLSHI